MKRKWKNQTPANGFTLVELMIVVAIIGILASIAIPYYRGIEEQAILTEGVNLIEGMSKSAFAYRAANDKNPSLTEIATDMGIQIASVNSGGLPYFAQNNSPINEWVDFFDLGIGSAQAGAMNPPNSPRIQDYVQDNGPLVLQDLKYCTNCYYSHILLSAVPVSASQDLILGAMLNLPPLVTTDQTVQYAIMDGDGGSVSFGTINPEGASTYLSLPVPP